MESYIKDKEPLDMSSIVELSVTRSFSKKIQIEQYEPIEVFASFSARLTGGCEEVDAKAISRQLYELATAEVGRDIDSYYRSNKKPF
jgi:hypothetical protein